MKDIFSFAKETSEGKVLKIAGIIFLSCCFSLAIISYNPNLWLIVVAIPVTLILFKNIEFGFILIMFLVFFSDWFFQLGIIPAQLTWLTELIIIFYILAFIHKKKYLVRTPINVPILLFILMAVVSMLINENSPIATFLALRLDLKFILMFLLLVTMNFREGFFKRMISILTVLLVLQIPVALGKLAIYGQGESAIGTYGAWGGALSTILPLLAIPLFAGFYLYKYETPRFRYILCIVGFIFFSAVGGKKGFIIFGLILILFLIWQAKAEYLRRFIPIGLVSLLGFFGCIYLVPLLKPVLEDLQVSWQYYVSYTTGYTIQGEAAGIISAIEKTYTTLKTDPVRFLIGYGPGSTIKSYFKEYDTKERGTRPVGIRYGFTHLVTTVIEYGYIGFLLYFLLPLFLLFKMNQKFYKNIKDKYWKAISFGFGGMLFSCFILGIFYWDLFRIDLAAFIFWFFAAAIYSMGKQHKIL